MIANPKNIEKGPWKMFFIGLIYASLSIILVQIFFSGDETFSKFSGILVVTFCVMFSLPFMYYIIKQEEKEDEEDKIEGFFEVWRIHKDAIYSLLWLFLGFIIAFSLLDVTFQVFFKTPNIFNAQLETYCIVNYQGNIEDCIKEYGFTGKFLGFTGEATNTNRFLSILINNTYVMIFTLLFSLIFGAGAIFVLAWNATVIAEAIGIFTKYQISEMPIGIARYMIHGFPEIAAYFIAALAGGMFGVGFIRNGIKNEKFFKIIEHTIILLFISIIILVVASALEVYITPVLFK